VKRELERELATIDEDGGSEEAKETARGEARKRYKSHFWGVRNRHTRDRTLSTWNERLLKRAKAKEADEAQAGDYRSIQSLEDSLAVRQKMCFGADTAHQTRYARRYFTAADRLRAFNQRKLRSADRRQTRTANTQHYDAKLGQYMRKVIGPKEFLGENRRLKLTTNHATRNWPKPNVPDSFLQPVIAFGKGPNSFTPGRPFSKPYAPVAVEVRRRAASGLSADGHAENRPRVRCSRRHHGRSQRVRLQRQ
jgi:hypothetical protein